MKYTTLFFDADDTLLDFQTCERQAMEKTLTAYGLKFTPEFLAQYHEINHALWSDFEKGKITKDVILAYRFRKTFEKLKMDVPLSYEVDYQNNVAENGVTLPGAVELVKELSQKYAIYICTNGVADTQARRLAHSGLMPYVKDVFISETLGYNKPHPLYFEKAMEKVEEKDKSKILMIGDSLSSDIMGANKSGFPSCWYCTDPKRSALEKSQAKPDFIVSNYDELRQLLEKNE